MKFDTAWPYTKTFFPLLSDYLVDENVQKMNTLLIGGADGKFAIPLSKISRTLTILECDDSCFIDTDEFESLPSKLQRYQLDNTEVLQMDFQTFQTQKMFELIFTSCSWHYSRNREFGVWKFVDKILELSQSGTLLFLEYMMPSEDWHYNEERYLQERQLVDYISSKKSVEIIHSFYTDIFLEKAHFAVPYEHTHKMGAFMGRIL